MILQIDRSIINIIIAKIYKRCIPRNTSIIHIINKLYNKKISQKNYKIYGMKYNNEEKIKGDENDYIIETISFIDDYSPLLSYYENNNYKFTLSDESIDNIKYSKFENIIDFYLTNNIINMLCEEDKYLLKYINGIINNKNYYKKILFILIHHKDIDPDFIVDLIKVPKNIQFKITL
ncbi:hypothetical protein [Alphaentomopoxvirus acuprea]|uniref:Uncharacterized protein n=1 Tax=Alphaentomopoxvirus acuprea TaxID=62099 RepID=W6JL17_9POXV|nr:hypothetical protein BA82_gp155 [Anomala cuprea entomopoxvirus]BAO49515.1 hypothetical protein [Anomala cuprea entomopoxvirus]